MDGIDAAARCTVRFPRLESPSICTRPITRQPEQTETQQTQLQLRYLLLPCDGNLPRNAGELRGSAGLVTYAEKGRHGPGPTRRAIRFENHERQHHRLA